MWKSCQYFCTKLWENIFFQTFSGRLNVCHTFVTDTWQQTHSYRQLDACNFLPDNLSYQCSRQQTFSWSWFSSRFLFHVTTLPVTDVKHGYFQTVRYGNFLPDNRNSVIRSHAFQKITFQNQTKWAPVIKKPFCIPLRTPEVSWYCSLRRIQTLCHLICLDWFVQSEVYRNQSCKQFLVIYNM